MRRMLGAAAAALVVGALLAGCGGGKVDGTSTTPGAGDTRAPAPSAPPPPMLNIDDGIRGGVAHWRAVSEDEYRAMAKQTIGSWLNGSRGQGRFCDGPNNGRGGDFEDQLMGRLMEFTGTVDWPSADRAWAIIGEECGKAKAAGYAANGRP